MNVIRRRQFGSKGLDTDGLICYWDCEDIITNNKWVDRINSVEITLGGTATKTSAGIRFDNTSSVKAAYGTTPGNFRTLLNNEIEKEFTCIVECLVKFAEEEKTGIIVDFCSLGDTRTTNIALLGGVKSDGNVINNAKLNGSSNNWDINEKTSTGGKSLPLNTYIPITIKVGTELSNDTQKAYCYSKTLGVYSACVTNTPVNVNFQGVNANPTPIVLGAGYLGGNAYQFPVYKADVIYKKILIYNKVK